MTSFTFRPAKREGVNVLVSFAGGTGSGKTFSAMEFASGLAGGKPFAVGDTEARRALHYADRFRFDHAEIKPPFRPGTYMQFLIDAEAAGYSVALLDSGSHEHAGEGGLLDWHDQELEEMIDRKRKHFEEKGWRFDEYKTRQACAIAAWIKPKGEHKRYVQRMLQSRMHIVLCLRAEEKIEIGEDAKGKPEIRPKQTPHGRDGWTPICEKSLPYEMTCSFLLKAERPGIPIPIKLQEQHRAMFPLDAPVGRRAGELMAAWAGGEAERPAAAAPSDRLAEALNIIARARNAGELDAVGKGLAAAGLTEDELVQAREAFKARGSKLRAEASRQSERREPGAEG